MASKPALYWTAWNRNHIKKHSVTEIEVDEVYQSNTIAVHSYDNRIILFGKTVRGRHLTIVISQQIKTKPYVVSARDMSSKERKIYETKTD